MKIMKDNQGAITIAKKKTHVAYASTKHIDIHFHNVTTENH